MHYSYIYAGSFDTLIPLLPKDLRILAIDTPGHGLSDHFPPDIAYNFMDSLVAIERLAAQLKWSKFSFLAHSLGGCAAMMYTSIFPEKVEKLILLDILRVTPTITTTVDYR